MIKLDKKMNVIIRARLSPMAGARFAARVAAAAETRRCQSLEYRELVRRTFKTLWPTWDQNQIKNKVNQRVDSFTGVFLLPIATRTDKRRRLLWKLLRSGGAEWYCSTSK